MYSLSSAMMQLFDSSCGDVCLPQENVITEGNTVCLCRTGFTANPHLPGCVDTVSYITQQLHLQSMPTLDHL